MKQSRLIICALVFAACSSKQPPLQHSSNKHDQKAEDHAKEEQEHAEASKDREPLRVQQDGSELYGSELSGEREVVALSTIVASAPQYDGKVVRTEGTITAVCKKMGCWIEIASEGTGEVRVPMAGHAYFLPEAVKGKKATVEGKIEVQPLSEEMKKHLEEEGAKATENEVSISATTVLVHPDKADS